MDVYEVAKKLLGPIEPVGETNADAKRYENLEATINLVAKLMSDLSQLTNYAYRPEASMKKAGLKALSFIEFYS